MLEQFNECGVQAVSTKAVSTKAVAKRQEGSERVIFNYLQINNELLITVLDHFSKYDNLII